MCIAKSVGRNGANHRDDAKTVQILLNLNLEKILPIRPLAEDGAVGNVTIAAIEEFQRRVLGMQQPDGRVDPGGATLAALRAGMPTGFSEPKLHGIMIQASFSLAHIMKYCGPLAVRMPVYAINTPVRRAHFLAQLAHESGELRYSEEIASGKAYEGRTDLGNTQPGDGVRFKGRGLIQITGRTNYEAFGEFCGADYSTDSAARLLATDPFLCVEASCWFWNSRNLNTLADADDVVEITRKINGGQNGLTDRKAHLVRAKFFLTS